MNTIVKMPEPKDFPVYNKLTGDMKKLFEFALDRCNRFITFESLSEIGEYLKDSDLTEDQKKIIKQTLRDFGFSFNVLFLSKYVDKQKILFIYDK